MSFFPDGWFIKNMIVWGDPPQYVAKGFEFTGIDRSNASDNTLEDFEHATRTMLAMLSNKWRMQVCFSVTNDYRKTVMDYDNQTIATNSTGWCKQQREERATRFWAAIRDRVLRKEVVRIYFSREIKASPLASLSRKDLSKFWNDVLDEINIEYELLLSGLKMRFSPVGCGFTPLNDLGHFEHLSEYLQPSLSQRFNFDRKNQFRPDQTVWENCGRSDMVSGKTQSPPFGFGWDGYFHNILTFSRLPDDTYEDTVLELTHTELIDYRMTVNVYPKERAKAKKDEQRIINSLKASYAASADEELLTEIEMRKDRLQAITTGAVTPLSADYIFVVWAETPRDLSRRTEQLKEILERLSGARYMQPQHFSTSKKLFFQGLPGWIYGKYNCHAKYNDDKVLARLLPLSNSFVGHTDFPQALYDSDNGAVAGLTTIVNGQPQHAVLLGMSGAGKSIFLFDLLGQILPFFYYSVIIEEGNSHGPLVKKFGGQSIILQADGEQTINYLDCLGLPLSHSQTEMAAALASRMAGTILDEDKQYLKTSLITAYIRRLYTRTFENWIKFRPEKLDYFARLTMAVFRVQKKLKANDPTTTFVEAFAYAKENEAELDIARVLASYTSEEVSRFYKTSLTQYLVRDIAFAFIPAEEQPRHASLVEAMKMTPMSHHDKQLVRDIATVLETWTAHNGSNGKLFDGITNITLNNKLTQFELGLLRTDSSVKAMAGFLISNYVRRIIMSMPRKQPKLVIYEEAARILDIPGGEKMIEENYAQLRKYLTWVISTVQQYEQFKRSRIRPIVFGNSKQFFISRQNDRKDVDDFGDAIGLPEATRKAIMEYTLPEHVNYEYSEFTYYHMDAQRPVCGTIINRVSQSALEAIKDYWEKQTTKLVTADDLLTTTTGVQS